MWNCQCYVVKQLIGPSNVLYEQSLKSPFRKWFKIYFFVISNVQHSCHQDTIKKLEIGIKVCLRLRHLAYTVIYINHCPADD